MGNVTVRALFSEVRILGDAAFTRKPIANQNGAHGTVAACDKHARGQQYGQSDLYASFF